MELLTRMLEQQDASGAVDDGALRSLAQQTGVPLHRLEGLRGFYPQFRRHPVERPVLSVCRDMVCRQRLGMDPVARVHGDPDITRDFSVEGASCLGRCDHAPAALRQHTPLRIDVDAEQRVKLSSNPEHAPRQWPLDPYSTPSQHYATLQRWAASGDIEELLNTLKSAGLRGMGGAGFPTGVKWEACRTADRAVRAVICNADESEPGTFKDRVILAELPHLVIEGMLLAAWVTGAREGIIYLRHEYEPERERLEAALREARDRGLLGPGHPTGFDIRVFVSPGGYILGEETALLEALEDRRGEPRNKPPFPVSRGLGGEPTLINNVETLAACVGILHHGADWWREQGRGQAEGLKLLAVSGDVERPDVYCVPMGTTARELLALAGGVQGGKPLLAFFPGGASTNPLPAGRLDTPMDWDSLREAGSALGSGAVTFVAEGRDLLDLVLAQTRFFRNESCGKCVPCRVGTQKAVALVESAIAGDPVDGLPELLRQLNGTLARTSICGLGQVALAPLVALMQHFPQQHWQALATGEAG